MGGNDTSKRRCQFRAQRHLAVAFVHEMEKLSYDLGTALFAVDLGRFQDGAVPFDKATTPGELAPFRENVVSLGTIVWQKIAKTGQWLDWIRHLNLTRPGVSTRPRLGVVTKIITPLNKLRLEGVVHVYNGQHRLTKAKDTQ